MKVTGSHRKALGAIVLLIALSTPACQSGLSTNAHVAPTQQIPVVAQVAEGYKETRDTATGAVTDLALAANDAAWAIAAAPVRVLFGLTPFEPGYAPAVIDHRPEKTSPESRRKRRRRSLGLEPAAEDRIEARRSRHRLEMQRDQQRQN